MSIAHVAKYTRGQIGGLTRHYERARNDKGQYIQFGNQEINTSLSNQNYNLAPERNRSQLSFIAKRCAEVKCSKRDDVNVMCSWVITAPAGLATSISTRADGSEILSFDGAESNLKRFFEESYRFLNDRYALGSDRNIISAYVHMDETTPHLHYAFVPVVHIQKTTPKGKQVDEERVSAKDLVNRGDLKTFHQDLEKHMTQVFGHEVGILNEATKDGNMATQELKKRTAIAEAEAELKNITRPIEGRISHEKRINQMAEGMTESKNLFTGKITTTIKFEGTKEEAMTVINAAKDRDRMRLVRDKAVSECTEAVSARDKAVSERNAMEKKLDTAKKGIRVREQNAKTKEQSALQAQKQATEKQAQADALYQQQSQLNQLHRQAIAERDGYKHQLETEKQKTTIFTGEKAVLSEKLDNAWNVTQNTVQAIGLLKHSENKYNKGNLTPEQGRLVDAVANYAEKWARNDGFVKHAENINKTVRISEGVEREIKSLEPKSQSRSYGMDR